MKRLLPSLAIILCSFLTPALAGTACAAVFAVSLNEAEHLSLESSNDIKAYKAQAQASEEQALAQFAYLYPKLTFDGNYHYLTNVPKITLPIPGIPASFPFGTHDNYSVGPTLSYTLWDTFAARNSYRGLDLLSQAQNEDRKKAELDLLLNLRTAYLHLQLALEELRLLNNSLELSKAQNKDIESNYRAGAATQLDRVDSQRDVINYQLQFQQKQAEVAADLKDLLALLPLQMHPLENLAQPGPPGVSDIKLEVQLDSLDSSLTTSNSWQFPPPGEKHPSLASEEFRAESAQKAASSQLAILWPMVQVSANTSLEYPNGIIPESVYQNTFMVSLSMPLFEGFHAHHLAEEKMREADGAQFRKQQVKINLDRDYIKGIEMLGNLRVQQKLAETDVERSATAARLYYESYKLGRINLIDVQSANNRALTAKVNAARIDAQILSQLYLLRYLSGEAI